MGTHTHTGNLNVHPPTEDDNEGWGITVYPLIKGIGSLLFNRDMPIESNTNMDEAMLHATHADNVTDSNVFAELGTTAMKLLQLMVMMNMSLLGLILLLVPLGIF